MKLKVPDEHRFSFNSSRRGGSHEKENQSHVMKVVDLKSQAEELERIIAEDKENQLRKDKNPLIESKPKNENEEVRKSRKRPVISSLIQPFSEDKPSKKIKQTPSHHYSKDYLRHSTCAHAAQPEEEDKPEPAGVPTKPTSFNYAGNSYLNNRPRNPFRVVSEVNKSVKKT